MPKKTATLKRNVAQKSYTTPVYLYQSNHYRKSRK